jgi:TPR repeat protein
MNSEGCVVDKAELIKWFDALDALCETLVVKNTGLEKARRCRLHPDALWVCALFHADAVGSRVDIARVMDTQGDDPRALFIRGCLTASSSLQLRAAELGYAPAEAMVAQKCRDQERLEWARKASAKGDRTGLMLLGDCFFIGTGGCAVDKGAAMALFRQAADLEKPQAFLRLAQQAESVALRYYFWGRAAARGHTECCCRLLLAERRLEKASGEEAFELGRALRGACSDALAKVDRI